jgi:hypothetical protein
MPNRGCFIVSPQYILIRARLSGSVALRSKLALEWTVKGKDSDDTNLDTSEYAHVSLWKGIK